MKKLLLIIVILLFAAGAYAGDVLLTCTPQEGAEVYKLEYLDVEEISDAKLDGAAWHDLENVPVGETPSKLSAGKRWTVDGIPQLAIAWSDPTPFVLGRPILSQLQPPENMNLKNRENH